MRTVLVALLLVMSVSCGDDDPPPAPDAMVDAGTPDAVSIDAANPQTVCTMYCECMDDRCSGSFADMQTCMDTCLGLDTAAQDCRLEHCGLAVPGQEAVHCPHARGESFCD